MLFSSHQATFINLIQMGNDMNSTLSSCLTFVSAFGVSALASPAFADPGHIEAAGDGHSHYLALGAVCVALIVGGVGFLYNIKLRKLKADKSS